VRISPDDAVRGGSINLESSLTVRVTSPWEESSISKVLELVERAIEHKSPVERFITRFARVYTPAVFFCALLTALVPPVFLSGYVADASLSTWIYRALVLLVISCPCALMVSVPLGYFGGIGAASRYGILVKGGIVFDALQKIRTAVFDKTGTLTLGVFKVTKIAPAPGVSQADLILAARIAELHSNHPIARSIARLDGPAISASDVSAREIAGHGMRVEYQGHEFNAGNQALMDSLSIPVIPDPTPGAVVYVARDRTFLGSIVISDELRPDSAAAIKQLRELGFRTIMLSGDRPETAAWVSRTLDIDTWRAGLLPEHKVQAIRELIPDPSEALFVGDGLNDTPSLVSVGVGIAMGGDGSAAAMEIADAVVLSGSPQRVPQLVAISRKTARIVRQNISLAMGTKFAFMALGLVGIAGLWEAVFADVGVALLAVLNAARTAKA
jgi:Cd2+/Zn2+-exporting ATPase